MPEKTAIERALLATFERDPLIDLHHNPIQLEYDPAQSVSGLQVGGGCRAGFCYPVAGGMRDLIRSCAKNLGEAPHCYLRR